MTITVNVIRGPILQVEDKSPYGFVIREFTDDKAFRWAIRFIRNFFYQKLDDSRLMGCLVEYIELEDLTRLHEKLCNRCSKTSRHSAILRESIARYYNGYKFEAFMVD